MGYYGSTDHRLNLMDERHKVLIVGYDKTYMINSIIEQLYKSEIVAHYVPACIENMSKLTDHYEAVIIYVEEKILAKTKELVFVTDYVTEHAIPVVLVGYPQDMADVKQNVPEYLVAKEFPRPINLDKFTSQLELLFLSNVLGGKKKILVVDDSGAALRMIKGWFENKYQVILANSGLSALKFLTQDKPDLLLLDYDMPVADGRQILEMIRSEAEFSDFPVIFLTAKDDTDSVMNVMSLKPDGYLLKSMPPNEIVRAVDTFFEEQKGRR